MLTKRPILSLIFSLSLITGEGALLQLAYADANDLEGYLAQHQNGLSDVGPAGDTPEMEGTIDDYLGRLWLEFSFDSDWENWAKGCRPAGTGHWCLVGDNAVVAIDSPWNFTAPPGGVKLTVTDAFLFGDVFEVYDFGNLVGTTSDTNGGGECGPNPDNCLGFASSGSFTLSPGPHSITIKNRTNPFKAGAAYFRLDALDHLVCYKIKKLPKQKFKKQDVRIDNQFGWMDVQVIRPDLLCVPSTKKHLYGND